MNDNNRGPYQNPQVKYAEVVPNKLNLRKTPSKDSEVVWILNGGAKLEIKQTLNSGWTRVWFGGKENGYSGFVMTEYIKEV